ncbi:hypothetical protein I314_01821 [Cryptococcus bacillisporus CA1873]|uniref:Uncharacterized protein n=1 Tax=Cryptococcus bacillisporus CA1873 TaxID=1296111 RepID=A0ABR5BGK0_CRYGA|nr:hypothetical protein I314_01821 [Cryptococcus bacillisporus CA1873]|eukprot:KIR68321.1 hypothetical protein I314_01821 [Cryptococcus gattii CA1873]
MTFSSLADELATAFDNEHTASNSLAAEFGLDLDLDQELNLQTRAGDDGLGYCGHWLEEELARGGFGQPPLPDGTSSNFGVSPPARSKHSGAQSLDDESDAREGVVQPLSQLQARHDNYDDESPLGSIASSPRRQQFNLDHDGELLERHLHWPPSSRNELFDDHDNDISSHDNLASFPSELSTSPSGTFRSQRPLSTFIATPLRPENKIHEIPLTRSIFSTSSSPSPSSSSTPYGSRRLMGEDQDPLLVLSETIAMNSKFINSLQHLDEVRRITASRTPRGTPGKFAGAASGQGRGGSSGTSIPEPRVTKPGSSSSLLFSSSRETTSTSIPLSIDIHLQNHLAALVESEKRREDQLRVLNSLVREFEGLKWSEGLMENEEWDRFVEKRREMGTLEEKNENGDVSILEQHEDEPPEDVPNSNLTPSTPIRRSDLTQFYPSPCPLPCQTDLQLPLQTFLSTSLSLTTSLNNLSDSLHNSSSLSTHISRQIKNLRASVSGFREREVREEEARRGIEDWERGRMELGLGGRRVGSAAAGLAEATNVQVTQREKERVKSVKEVLEKECEEFKSKLEEYGKQVEQIQTGRSSGTIISIMG